MNGSSLRFLLDGSLDGMPRRYQNPKLEVRSDVSRPYYFVRVAIPTVDGERPGRCAYRDSVSKLLMRHRNRSSEASKPERPRSPGRAGWSPTYWPCGVRCTSGVTFIWASVRNLRT
jgi:hypothetical protein